MKNFEKVIKNLDSPALAYLLYKSKACPYSNNLCGFCEFYSEGVFAGYCYFPSNDLESISEWLEQEEKKDDE